MSADNGIYILKTKDQYRVTHAMAIDNIYWSHIDGDHYPKLVPTRVVEYWGGKKYTRNEETALKVANAMLKHTYICEYGINTIVFNKTWKHIVEDAKEYAVKEIEYLKNNHTKETYAIQKLQKIIDGKYD